MPVPPSPLERWFTQHPAPYQVFLGGAAAAAWCQKEISDLLELDSWPHFGWDYATPEGDPELREAIAAAEGLPHRNQVLLTLGASEANYLAFLSLITPEDEVIIQSPSYPQFECLAQSMGARMVPCWMPAASPSAIDEAELISLMTPRTRLIVLNSPHNPSGRELTPQQLKRIVDAVRRHPIAFLLVDEVYRDVGGAGPNKSRILATLGPERLMVSQSVSKSWALPGVRTGWLAGDKKVIQDAIIWREHLGLALPSVATAWVKHLWPYQNKLITANQTLLGHNRRQVAAFFSQHPWLHWDTSAATAIGLLGVRPEVLSDFDARKFALACYAEERALLVPGCTIGYPGRLRIGYGHRSAETLAEAVNYVVRRLSFWVESVAPPSSQGTGSS
ncbi:MAG: pyridoxal phosphate-dependent aminotransferase [Candidatus Sericytochromatia bacterium]|nr:pyridoxal phosphate-dependent aminotransferase [Candidatus Sericytochromatia bacterium]